MMDALIENKNLMIESPTGTGKTLALLATALGYLKQERENQFLKSELDKPLTKIIYASRTHS